MFYFLICLGEPAHRTGKRSHNNKRNTKCEKGSSQTTSDNLFNDTARANTNNNKNNRANRTKRYSETKDDRKAGWSTGWPKSSGKKMISFYHRRRIKTEEKVKVVASVWGEECIQFLAALAILPRTILKNRTGANHPIINKFFICLHPSMVLMHNTIFCLMSKNCRDFLSFFY